jgi:hypothetical protein
LHASTKNRFCCGVGWPSGALRVGIREPSVSSGNLEFILRRLLRAWTYHFRPTSRANSISCVGLPQQYRLTVEDEPEAAALQALPQALEDFNEGQWPGHGPWRPLGILIRDAETIVAGLSGETYCGWLVIKYLWVRDDLRRRGIGRELLKIQEFGVTDNFFELGGNSLLAMRVLARVRKAFEVEVSIRCFFDGPSIEELLHEIEKAKASGAIPRMPAISPALRPRRILRRSRPRWENSRPSRSNFFCKRYGNERLRCLRWMPENRDIQRSSNSTSRLGVRFVYGPAPREDLVKRTIQGSLNNAAVTR